MHEHDGITGSAAGATHSSDLGTMGQRAANQEMPELTDARGRGLGRRLNAYEADGNPGRSPSFS